MVTELQAWVGHVLIVGGRAVRMTPPGALAETAPKRAPRIREGDTFFILVTPAGDLRAAPTLLTELAQVGADTYFGSSGGITSGLREALTTIHQQAAGQPVHALALVQRGSDLYAARSGQAFAALCQGESLRFFPEDRRDPLAQLTPLGTGPAPDIQLTHYTAAPGQAILLADLALIEAGDEALREALNSPHVQAALDALKTLAGGQASLSVIRFTAPGTAEPSGIMPPSGSRGSRATPSVPRISKPSAPVEPAIEPPAPASPPPEPIIAPPPVHVAEPARLSPQVEESFDFGDKPHPLETVSGPGFAQENPGAAFSVSPSLPAERGAGGEVAPPRPRRTPLRKARILVKRIGRDALRTVLSALVAVMDFLTRAFNQILPAPGEGGKQGIPTNVAVGLAVLIPFLIVVVVVGLALSQQGQSDFEVYLDRAKTAHQEALSLSAGKCDTPEVRVLWAEVMRLADQANDFRPNDPNIVVIRADAQNYLDRCDRVQRRDLTLLHQFDRNAELIGPIVNGGIDAFTLDRTNGAIYHDTLNESGDGLTSRDDDPIIWRGQTIASVSGTYTVGDLFDIEWLRSGGAAHDNVLIGLDRNGILVAYSLTFFESAQQLIIEGRWQNPVAMAVFRSNLYVLDEGANQIWRYVQPAGERSYSNAPEEYFNGDMLPDLAGAVDMGISDEGAIFVLFGDGAIKKYRRNNQGIAEEQPFSYRDRPPGAINSGVALFVDNDPASASLYIVDAQNDTVYETTWGGTYNSGYRPRGTPGAFDNLTGFFADAVARNNMYVVAGNRLYHFRRN
jgi:hypothetical protein